MHVKQLVNFVMVKQDDGREIVMKYMLTHRKPNAYGVLAEKHAVIDKEMHFVEECETRNSYSLSEALKIAEICTAGKVLPSTYLEIEAELSYHKNVGYASVVQERYGT